MNEIYFALVDLMEAQREYDKAESEYEGYSWGYHGQDYEDRLNEAKKRFKDGFKEAVREAIKKINSESVSDDGDDA